MKALVETDELLSQIAGGVAGRLRSLVKALDRLDRLESGSGVWKSDFGENELPAAASELTLRAIRTACEPTNYLILKLLAQDESLSMKKLLTGFSSGRLVLSERLNDLVQVGLATRMIDTDHAQITLSGVHLHRLIEGIIAEVRQQFTMGTTEDGAE